MAFSFFVDGKHYELVVAAQSGEVVHQRRLNLPRRHDIDSFVSKMLDQNRQQQDELRRFLGPGAGSNPAASIGDQLESGQLLLQLGPSAGGVGSARAPQGKSPYQTERQDSLLYSSTMRDLLASAGITAAERSAMGATGLSALVGGGSGHGRSDTGSSGGPEVANAMAGLGGVPGSTVAGGVSGPATSTGAGPHLAAPNAPRDHKIVVELAGRSRCAKQKLTINAIGNHSGERAEMEGPRFDFNYRHRCVVEFKGIVDQPRALQLVIPTSGPSHQIKLPLLDNIEPSAANVDKPEWDTVLVPVKPLAYINKQKQRQQTDMLKPGFVYIFWRGRLWRELEIDTNHALRDVNVAFYRDNWNGDLGQHVQRKAEGHWLHDVWVPYKLNGVVQSGNNAPCVVYSESQWDWPYVESLEKDSAKLAAISTTVDFSQYSQQQNFHNNSGPMTSIKDALLDQQIDDGDYQIISPKGRQLRAFRDTNIPVLYLAPAGNKFILKVEDEHGNPLRSRRFQLKTSHGDITGSTDENGMLETALQSDQITGSVHLWTESDGDEPDYEMAFDGQGDSLPDVSTVKGQQARLNLLGFNAGTVDGIQGRKTKAAVTGFQTAYSLQPDGICGPKTQAKLKKIYGH